MKIVEKERARNLRKKGYSMNQIIQETGFTKSSVSLWVRDVVLTKKQKEKISERGRSLESVELRRSHRLSNEKTKRQVVINQAKKDYTHISLTQLKLIGVILYLGEGGKTERGTARLSNSDPAVIKMMMRFFREVCRVEESRFRANVHAFSHTNVEKTEKYWSKITGIPRNQFQKTYVKASSASLQKRHTLPHGTFTINVCDTKLFLTIMGWIERIKELTIGDFVREDY